jgi:hypothetical protein
VLVTDFAGRWDVTSAQREDNNRVLASFAMVLTRWMAASTTNPVSVEQYSAIQTRLPATDTLLGSL